MYNRTNKSKIALETNESIETTFYSVDNVI